MKTDLHHKTIFFLNWKKRRCYKEPESKKGDQKKKKKWSLTKDQGSEWLWNFQKQDWKLEDNEAMYVKGNYFQF